MKKESAYIIDNAQSFILKMLTWANDFKRICFLNNNFYDKDKYISYDCILAVGKTDEIIISEKNNTPHDSFEVLKNFHKKSKTWLFGFLSYDLKNELENLTSSNFDGIQMPNMHFFIPEYILLFKNNQIKIISSKKTPEIIFKEILNTKEKLFHPEVINKKIERRLSKRKYLASVENIIKHIHHGDIYEMNFCQEFFIENAEIDPLNLYLGLNDASPSPFSCYYRFDDKYLLCASPERFLKKEKRKIISQPIKGTIRRGKDEVEDKLLKELLLSNEKEQSENVMIADLVRNDLSKTALPETVHIEELFGIYSFRQVHQMITTISSQMRNDVSFTDVLKHAFPMGSMTGAPKVKAMELIEEYENTKRGLYSGSVGYITPDEDFDFNVVIRSILYHAENKYLSFMAGSAITANSIAEKEYEECLLKVKAIAELFATDFD